MEYSYRQEVIGLEAFQAVFSEIKQVDPELGKNIELSLIAAVTETHDFLMKATTREQLQLALIKEQISIQAQSSQYLTITDEITMKKNHLLEAMPKIYHQFMDEVEQKLYQFFQQKELEMDREVEQDGSWYSGLRDTTKKSGGSVYNFTVGKINSFSKDWKGKEVIPEQYLVDTHTIVEALLEKHLSIEKVAAGVSGIFESAMEKYNQTWMNQLATHSPDLKRLSTFSLAHSVHPHLKVTFQLGEAEKVFAMGIGSAVMGTVGLAAGWHTLTYAMLNVFPPIAIFAAIATVLVGVFTKDKAIEKRKRDLHEAVTRYHHYFLQQLYVLKLEDLDQKSVSEYVEGKGQKIVEEAVAEWEKKCFGRLKLEHFRKLNQAFMRHLLYINEAIEYLEIK